MIFRAHVEDGRIVPDDPLSLVEGTRLEFRVVPTEEELRQSRERLKRHFGAIELPPDASSKVNEVPYGEGQP